MLLMRQVSSMTPMQKASLISFQQQVFRGLVQGRGRKFDSRPIPGFIRSTGTPTIDDSKIYVTQVGYEKRKKEFDHLMNVEFTENARDLGEAISRGDLRENAEYKAGGGKQAMLVEKAERLKAELQKVVIIDPRFIQTDTIVLDQRLPYAAMQRSNWTCTPFVPLDADIEKGLFLPVSHGKRFVQQKGGRHRKALSSRKGHPPARGY